MNPVKVPVIVNVCLPDGIDESGIFGDGADVLLRRILTL
jgi:hypothetical protein